MHSTANHIPRNPSRRFRVMSARDGRMGAASHVHATPADIRVRRTRRPFQRLTLRRVARRLSSPAASLVLLALLFATGYRTWAFMEDRRLEQQLAVTKTWNALDVRLPRPVTTRLETHHANGFLHYTFVVSGADPSPAALEDTLNRVAFTLRLIDKDGFTVVVLRPPVPTRGKTGEFRVEDVVGCSKGAYAGITSWAVEWEGA